MNVTSNISDALHERQPVVWRAVWTWVLCLGLVIYLSLEGGGYDPLVSSAVGVAVWWIVALGVLAGALPVGRLGPLALAALVALALFATWTTLGLTWTESAQKTWLDIARIGGYVGILALGLLSCGSERGRWIVAAVGSAIAFVGVLSLLSRLHAAWFSTAQTTARLLDDPERLSFPLNYWNAIAALVAIGLPLLLQQASEARSLLARAAAAASFPALSLAIFYTLSRGGIATTAVALGVYLVFAGDRLPKLLTLVPAAAGSALLIAEGSARGALRHGLDNAAARDQGDTMLLMTIGVCAAVAAIVVAGGYAGRRIARPAWTSPSPGSLGVASGIAVLAIVAIGLAAGGAGKLETAWSHFKAGSQPGLGTTRLDSISGESRYAFWRVAEEENASRPLLGTGSGTWEFWWAPRSNGSIAKDTHSIWLQTLGETGIIGLALLVGFFGTVLIGGAGRLLRLPPSERSPPSAALAGVVAFCVVSTFDWMWRLPALVAPTLLLAAALVGPWRSARGGPRPLLWPVRAAIALSVLIAVLLIALPTASNSLLRASEADAREGNLGGALTAARRAHDVLPSTAAPRLQEALVLERLGRYPEAVTAARAAARGEPVNWRNLLVLSRIEAENGEAAAAVHTFSRARKLYPRLQVFEEFRGGRSSGSNQ